MDLVPYIFHEQQEGNLCAQHCLNALLQGPYFTAIELADLARQLDQREQDALNQSSFHARSGAKSQNMDDSGFFSVQVISEALAIWQLQIIPWGSQDVKDAKQHPEFEQAFILNLHEHWFTLRRFGPSSKRWYDLNSVHPAPRPMSDTFLGMTLSQLEAEQYSVFVVRPLQGPIVPPEVVHVPISPSSSLSSSSKASVTIAAPASTAASTSSGADPTSSATGTMNAFMAERREMERIRRQRLEERERQKNGGGNAASSTATTNTSAAAVASTRTRVDPSGNEQQQQQQRDNKTVTVVKTPSCLPTCEADRVALTLPYDQFESNNNKGSKENEQTKKEEPFSGTGYRLGAAASDVPNTAAEEDAMLAAALASSSAPGQGDNGDIDETEWEMMQQAIAISLQK